MFHSVFLWSKRSLFFCLIFTGMLLGVTIQSSFAFPITFNISGNITGISRGGNAPSLSDIPSITLGTTWSSTIVLDSDTPDLFPDLSVFGQYAVSSFSFNIGPEISYSSNDFVVPAIHGTTFSELNIGAPLDNSAGALFNFVSFASSVDPPIIVDGVFIDNGVVETFSIEKTVIKLEQLLALNANDSIGFFANTNLSDLTGLNRFAVDVHSLSSNRFLSVDGSVTSFEVTGEQSTIPEPTTIALLGIGLAGLTGAEVRRRRKKIPVNNS